MLGLLRVGHYEWYIMRRQQEGYDDGFEKLEKRYPLAKEWKKWNNVSHSVDIGNLMKKHLRELHWNAHRNTLKLTEKCKYYDDDEIVDIFDRFIGEQNEVHKLVEKLEL